RREAAHRLGWPEGTVASRQARARELLARRLSRLGFAVSAGSMAAFLAGQAAAAVPAALLAAALVAARAGTAANISESVAAVAEGVLKSMSVSKLPMFA